MEGLGKIYLQVSHILLFNKIKMYNCLYDFYLFIFFFLIIVLRLLIIKSTILFGNTKGKLFY